MRLRVNTITKLLPRVLREADKRTILVKLPPKISYNSGNNERPIKF